ncbi:NAD(P)H-dependent oxidoreductase [Roseivirga seohaensis]|uniref:NAD(P)H-dependent oxidoreductase n=1 Tax=Roseivirga seohaensis TaxID=1914963 RepID=UPI003BAA9C01
MELLKILNWRYATKKFDSTKRVDHSDLEKLKEAIQLSVSSYGLQLYKVLIIENQEIRRELKKASWNQSQITDASQLFIFCNYKTNCIQEVDNYIKLVADTQNTDVIKLQPYGDSIKTGIKNMSPEQRNSWAEKQTYIAMSNLIIACAELKIDACPMEGFDSKEYNRILGLDEVGLNAALIATVGYRAADDEAQFRKKVRKSSDQLFQTI